VSTTALLNLTPAVLPPFFFTDGVELVAVFNNRLYEGTNDDTIPPSLCDPDSFESNHANELDAEDDDEEPAPIVRLK
jgi:hypothetical protein